MTFEHHDAPPVDNEEETRVTTVLRLALPVFVTLIGAFGAVVAVGFSDVGRRFPLFISLAIVVVGIIVLIREIVIMKRGGAFSAAEFDYQVADLVPSEVLRRGLLWLGVITGYLVTMWLIGYTLATVLFLLLTLRRGAGLRWWTALIAGVVGAAALYGFVTLLSLPLPEGVIYLGI